MKKVKFLLLSIMMVMCIGVMVGCGNTAKDDKGSSAGAQSTTATKPSSSNGAAGEVLTEAGKGLKEIATDAGKGAKELATDAGKGAKELATDVGNGLNNMGTAGNASAPSGLK